MLLPYIKPAQAYSNKYSQSLGKAAHAPAMCLKTREKSLKFWDCAAQIHFDDNDCCADCFQKTNNKLTQPFKRHTILFPFILQDLGVQQLKNPVPITDLISTSIAEKLQHSSAPGAAQPQVGVWNVSSLLCTRQVIQEVSPARWAKTEISWAILGAAPP